MYINCSIKVFLTKYLLACLFRQVGSLYLDSSAHALFPNRDNTLNCNLRSGPILAVLIHSLLCAPTKIGPDPKSHKLVLTAARFWLQRRLTVRTMPQDLIGCWNQRKLKALIPHVVIFANDPLSVEKKVLLSFYCFTVLW